MGASDEEIQRHKRIFDDAMERYANHDYASNWKELARIAASCAALGAKGAAIIGASSYPGIALAKGDWRSKALLGFIGLLPPEVAVEAAVDDGDSADYEAFDSRSGLPMSPQTHLNHCASAMIEKALGGPELGERQAFALWMRLASQDSLCCQRAVDHACAQNPRFNPAEALAQSFETGWIGRLEGVSLKRNVARAVLSADAFRPFCGLAPCLWLSAYAPTRASTGIGIGRLKAQIDRHSRSDRLRAILCEPYAWSSDDFEARSDSGYLDAFSWAAGNASAGMDGVQIASESSIFATWASQRLGEWPAASAKNSTLSEAFSSKAASWLFSNVSAADIKASSTPQKMGAWLDLCIASGQWKHYRELANAKTVKGSRLSARPEAFARIVASGYSSKSLPAAMGAIRKAAALSGDPMAFATRVASTLEAMPGFSGFAAEARSKLMAMGSLCERAALSRRAKKSPTSQERAARPRL